MHRNAFEPQERSRKSSPITLRATEQESAQGVERWPTPGELYFEAGIVLAVALGISVAIGLIMGGA